MMLFVRLLYRIALNDVPTPVDYYINEEATNHLNHNNNKTHKDQKRTYEMAARDTTFYTLLLASLQLLLTCHATFAAGGKWDLLLSNVGISAMHMQLLSNDRVVMFRQNQLRPIEHLSP